LESWRFVHASIIGGPSFNDRYASAWKDSRFEWCETERFMPIDKSSLLFEFKDYNSTFPPFFLIFWEDEPDDYKWMLGDIPPSDPDILTEITELAAKWSKKLLPDQDFSVPKSVIYSATSSNAFDGYERNIPEWDLEYEAPDSDWVESRLVFSRSFAFKRPTEARDIGIMTPQSMRLHRRIMYPLQKACRRIPGTVYGKDQPFIRRTVTELGDSCRYFYMRDYVKSGMTIPHAVIAAVLTGFYQSAPELAEAAVRAYRTAVLYISDGEKMIPHHLSSGVPLGMFVEGYTLLQYINHEFVSQQLGYKLAFNGNNDDVIVGSRDKEKLEMYVTTDSALQQDLGMSVKGTKTGISNDRFIYSEEYWDGNNILPKDVLFSLSILGAKYAINVVHAKELVGSILMSCNSLSNEVAKAVREVQSCFVPEFSDQEYRWPILFGGWWPTYYEGLDASILWRTGDLIADCAYWASQVSITEKPKLKESATTTLGRVYDLRALTPPEDPGVIMNLKPLFGNRKTLKNLYALLSRAPRDLSRKYQKLYLKRREVFNDYITARTELPSVTKGYIRRHPNTIIVKGMEGVQYTYEGFMMRPHLGKAVDSFEAKLRYWANQGWISAALPTKVSLSEKRAHAIGITDEFKYDFLPVAKGGASTFALTTHVPGLQKLWFEHKLFVAAIDDDDEQHTLSRHWEYLPVPLLWLYRLDTAVRVQRVQPICLDTAQAYFSLIVGQNVSPDVFIDWEHAEESEYYEPPIDDGEFESMIRTLLDSVNLSNIRAKLVPAGRIPVLERDLYGGPSDSGGIPYIQVSEGAWIPANSEQRSVSFWDNPDSDSEMPEFPWD
jgi:hypothetical protein